ncbi:jouberin-like [Thrips palmi]|uniref:Jouberin-like n=1 Tax=Thrips palmi TaxID=161013 RepID=A0A6P8YCH0_THRPL|nr:jouberin-like [Thrips palmi]
MTRKRASEDKIPLTESKSTILQETKARFDTLLKAAQSQDDDVEKMDGKMVKKSDLKAFKKRSKKKLSSSTQMLVSEEDCLSSSEMDVQEYSPKMLASPTLEQVRDFTSVSSSDELTLSPKRSASKINDEEVEIPSIDPVTELDILETPPKRPAPMPRKRHSTRDESRETTSSRVSSSDSVMTAIEASSPNRSIKLSSPENESPKNGEVEMYELKPLKGFSPSYEEIDETSLDRHEGAKALIEQTSSRMANAASYEEILEEQSYFASPERHNSDGNGGVSNESAVRNEKRNRQTKKTKLQMSQHKRRGNKEIDNTDTSSDNRVQKPVKQRRKRTATTESGIQSQSNIKYNYEKIIGISLHHCDSLKIDSLIRHPMVRVHVLDTLTGEYLKKSEATRNVSFYQENSEIDYIQPLTSQPCQFKDPRSLTPIWDETLVLNEDIQHILQPQSSILILFEVLDCVTFDEAIARHQKLGLESGWHRIAWAFLKPCGANNILNIDKKLRLQLYRPRSDKTYRGNGDCDKCDVYKWWRKGGWIHYPSTLHVTVYGLPMPSDIPSSLRSYCALQPEHGQSFHSSDAVVDNASGSIKSRCATPISLTDDVVWSRLPSQSCKIPNKTEFDLPAGLNGNFSIKFSNHGHHLAVSAANQTLHNIYVYKIPEGSEIVRFQGHPGIVYNLDWSQGDDLLLSASADCTACIWSMKSQKYVPLQMLPHPSFVYSAIFLPTNSLSLGTGCCDHVIRIWTRSDQTGNFELQQELNGHEGYVSTLCTNSSGMLFSGDSVGQIRLWQCEENQVWTGLRVLNVRELQGVVLSHLVLHPGGKRILALTRDSLLRMIDIGTGVAIQWFKGALNHRIHSKACISPCGSLVFSPSEDGTFHVWNADTGILVASYSGLFHTNYHASYQDRSNHRTKMSSPILSGAVDYHPFDHLIAFALYGAHTPVIVCKYDRDQSGKEIGLQIKHDNQREYLENESSVKHSKMEQITKSALIVSNIKSKIHLKHNRHNIQEPNDFQSSPEVIAGHESEDNDRAKKGEKQHLSYIIKQLDYVLQLGRASKQEQLGIVTPRHANSPRSNSVTPDSYLQVPSSPANLLESFESDPTAKPVKEIDTAVSYSLPHSYPLVQQLAESKVTSSQSLREDRSPAQMPISSPVELHYVQEKPPRPMPRHRRTKQARVDRRQSIPDQSTTDTSILSSENEEALKSVQVMPQPYQLVQENEQSRRNSKAPLPMYKRVKVGNRPHQVSSFESDSDDRPTKI